MPVSPCPCRPLPPSPTRTPPHPVVPSRLPGIPSPWCLPQADDPEVVEINEEGGEINATPVSRAEALKLISPGNRLQQSFRVSGCTGAAWFGGIIGDLEPDGRIPVGWDDGDLRLLSPDEVVFLYENSELRACTTKGGLVQDVVQSVWAAGLCMYTSGEEKFPVGVLMTDALGPDTLAGFSLYHTHIVSTAAVAALLESDGGKRPTRGKHQADKYDRAGYHTFRRGDRLVYIGKDNDTDSIIEGMCYGVLLATYGKKNQQLRLLVSFDNAAQEFSVSSWGSWKRVFTGDDPDLSSSVSVASSAEMDVMKCAWSAARRSFEAKASTIDKLKKLATLGPPSLKELKAAAQAEAARARKAKAKADKEAAETRKAKVKAKPAISREREQDIFWGEGGGSDEGGSEETTRAAAKLVAAKAKVSRERASAAAAEAEAVKAESEAAEAVATAEAAKARAAKARAARLAAECAGPIDASPQRRSPRLESRHAMMMRIESEERECRRLFPTREVDMRAEVRARLHGETAAGSSAAAGSSDLSRDDDEDNFQLRLKIARLEGEQRIDTTARREGELEVARLQLRMFQHKRHMH